MTKLLDCLRGSKHTCDTDNNIRRVKGEHTEMWPGQGRCVTVVNYYINVFVTTLLFLERSLIITQ